MSGGAGTEAKVLQYKSQRLQVQGRLDEWEEQFKRIHNREPTVADRQHSKQHRELQRLLDDVDALIASLEGGGGAPSRDSHGPRDIERRAERGRIKCVQPRARPRSRLHAVSIESRPCPLSLSLRASYLLVVAQGAHAAMGQRI